MNRRVKYYLKWLVAITCIGIALYYWKPIVKWLIIDKTIEVFNESKDLYQEEEPITYQGTITDTTYQRSKKYKGKLDTLVHRQSIDIKPKQKVGASKPNRNDIGLLGDSSAFLNTIFSILAFGGVIITFIYQLRKDSKDKIQDSRVQFEQEFFSMTTMLEEIVSHLVFTEPTPTASSNKPIGDLASFYEQLGDGDENKATKPHRVEGRAVFKYLYCERPENSLLSIVNSSSETTQTEDSQKLCFDGTLDHYYRYLYRILKHIDTSKNLDELDDPERERLYYAHILRAQLSCYELLMWYYNAILGENPGTVKVLIEKYQMFNNLRTWELGRNEKDYNTLLLDHDLLTDSFRTNEEKQYSIGAYWSKDEVKQFRKQFRNKPKRATIILAPWILNVCNVVKSSCVFNHVDKKDGNSTSEPVEEPEADNPQPSDNGNTPNSSRLNLKQKKKPTKRNKSNKPRKK